MSATGPPDSPSPLAALAAAVLRSRRLTRAPIWLYRARLGALLGPRMLMLEHTGRSSGARRRVVLEVVDHPAADRYVVASGFGERAQWFRNVQADPRVRIVVGSRAPAEAIARRLDRGEADLVMADYRQRRPATWRRFKPVLENTLGAPIGETDSPLPLVEFRLDAGPRR